jgi:DNA repair exonuclease SbcCD ATPase subunit
MLTSNTARRSTLGREIHQLANQLSDLKKLKPKLPKQEREAFNQQYSALKQQLQEAQQELKVLNQTPAATIQRKSDSKPPAYYYWFYVAATQYLPSKVVKAITDLAAEIAFNHQQGN